MKTGQSCIRAVNTIMPSIRVIACLHIALFQSLSSYRNKHVVFIIGCRGRPALLSGQEGKFVINEVPYSNMACSWRIRGTATKVCTNENDSA